MNGIDDRERGGAEDDQGVGMKEGWQTKTLGEILDKTETINPFLSPDTEFEYIDVSSVSNKTFEIEATQRLKGKFAPSRARKLVRVNDIIFATIRPTLQRIAVVPEHLDEQVCSTGYFVIRPKQGIDHRFVFYSLFTEDFTGQIESLQKGASYPAVTDGDVRAQEIHFPPLAEQQRIVALLDEAFAGLAIAKVNAERNLQNARAIFESHLQSVFSQRGDGWVECPLDELTEPDSQITYGVVKPGPEGEIRFVRGGDLVSGKVRLTQLRTITREVSDQYRRTLLRGGELLICLVGQPGQVGVAPTELAGANIARQVGLIRLSKKINAEFVRFFLQSAQGAEALGARESGSVQQVINLGELRQVAIPYPDFSEQVDIVARLNLVDAETQRLTLLYERKLAAMEELKKSLLHQAFNGEL
jgi:type I restriction enzyme S subunit